MLSTRGLEESPTTSAFATKEEAPKRKETHRKPQQFPPALLSGDSEIRNVGGIYFEKEARPRASTC